MRLTILTMAFLTTALCTQPKALDFKTGLITVSAGSWVAFVTTGDPLYFNKFSITGYMTVEEFKVVPTIPLAYTFERGSGKQRFFSGDGSLYIGRRIGEFEPRIGVIVPLGYAINTNWKNEAWIGTNNIFAQAGLSYGRAEDAQEGIPFTFETMISTPLTENNAFLRPGSVSAIAIGKTFWRLNDHVRWGAELMILASISRWNWTYEARPGVREQVVETSAGTVPNLWAEYQLTDAWYCSFKAGFGPNFRTSNQNPAIIHSGNSLNLSLGIQWYP